MTEAQVPGESEEETRSPKNAKEDFVIRPLMLLAVVLAAPNLDNARVQKEDMARIEKELKRTYFGYTAFINNGKAVYTGFGIEIGRQFYVVTSSNAVVASDKIQVQFFRDPKRKYDAQVMRADTKNKIAVLRITERSFWCRRKYLPKCGNTDTVAKGDGVVTLVCPSFFERWKFVFGTILRPNFIIREVKRSTFIQHQTKLAESEYGTPLYRITLKGGEITSSADETVTVRRTGHAEPYVEKVELIGMNCLWHDEKDGSRTSLALPIESVRDCVKRLVQKAPAAH